MKILVEDGLKRNEMFTGKKQKKMWQSEVKNVAKKAVANAMRNDERIEL